jgi:hypothetical protein
MAKYLGVALALVMLLSQTPLVPKPYKLYSIAISAVCLVALIAWLVLKKKKEGIEPAIVSNHSELDE